MQKLLKKCSEFQVVYEQYKVFIRLSFYNQNDREERIASVKHTVEEEKKRIDQMYRQKAQEMKREYERQMAELDSEI